MGIKLSATRISTFLQCKMRYNYGYVKRASKPANPAFRLGRAVHEALDFAGQILVSHDHEPFTKEQEASVLLKYQEFAIREGVYDSVDYHEGLSIIKKRLKNFENHGKIIALETQFGFENTPRVTTSTGVELIGAIDKVTTTDEDTLIITDYKTSRTVPDADKLRTDVQLSMYDLAARSLFPGYKRVILALDMLRVNELVYTYRTEEETLAFDTFLNEIHRQMSEFDGDKAKSQLNPLCSWCDFRNICDEYKAALDYDGTKVLPPEQLSVEDLHSEWSDVNSKLKLIKTRKDELATFIMSRLDCEVDPIVHEKKQFAIEQRKRVVYDPKDLIDIVPKEDFLDMISISSTKVKGFIDGNPKLKESVLKLSRTSFNSPFVSVKKLKK